MVLRPNSQQFRQRKPNPRGNRRANLNGKMTATRCRVKQILPDPSSLPQFPGCSFESFRRNPHGRQYQPPGRNRMVHARLPIPSPARPSSHHYLPVARSVSSDPGIPHSNLGTLPLVVVFEPRRGRSCDFSFWLRLIAFFHKQRPLLPVRC
jgi:hypothetical protein